MSTLNVRPVAVPQERERVGGLPRVDWSDAFSVDLPAGAPRDLDHWRAATFGTGRGIFAVIERTSDSIAVGSNHFHIDFRAVISVTGEEQEQEQLTITSLVLIHNIVGRTYMGIIGPFHRRIVPWMLHKAVNASSPPHCQSNPREPR